MWGGAPGGRLAVCIQPWPRTCACMHACTRVIANVSNTAALNDYHPPVHLCKQLRHPTDWLKLGSRGEQSMYRLKHIS